MKVLDSETKRLFEDKHSKTDFCTFEDLVSLAIDQYKVASLVLTPKVGACNFNPKSGKG